MIPLAKTLPFRLLMLRYKKEYAVSVQTHITATMAKIVQLLIVVFLDAEKLDIRDWLGLMLEFVKFGFLIDSLRLLASSKLIPS